MVVVWSSLENEEEPLLFVSLVVFSLDAFNASETAVSLDSDTEEFELFDSSDLDDLAFCAAAATAAAGLS